MKQLLDSGTASMTILPPVISCAAPEPLPEQSASSIDTPLIPSARPRMESGEELSHKDCTPPPPLPTHTHTELVPGPNN